VAAARDGVNFEYVAGDRNPWLQRGEAGGPPPNNVDTPAEGSAWDSSLVAVVTGIVKRDGVLRMYKFGDRVRHGQDYRSLSTGISLLELREGAPKQLDLPIETRLLT
jgi:hypothetical protein